jgi:glycosyltransferase 2 family protein
MSISARPGIIGGLLVSAACMWLASRNVEWPALATPVRALQAGPLLVALIGGLSAYAVMACRWRILLGPLAPVPLHDVFDAMMIGALSGMVIPQRLGDLVKAGLLARKTRASATAILATVAVERLTDVIALLVVAAVLVNTVTLPMLLRRGLWLVALAAAAAVVVLWKGPLFWQQLVRRVPRLVETRAGAFLDRSLNKFARGLEAAGHRRSLAQALALAGLVWLLAALAMTAYTKALGLGVPWYAGFLVIVVANLAGALPSSPGGVGVYHYATVIALTALSTDRTSALAFAFVTHAIGVGMVVVIGTISLLRQGLTLKAVRDEAASTAVAAAL